MYIFQQYGMGNIPLWLFLFAVSILVEVREFYQNQLSIHIFLTWLLCVGYSMWVCVYAYKPNLETANNVALQHIFATTRYCTGKMLQYEKCSFYSNLITSFRVDVALYAGGMASRPSTLSLMLNECSVPYQFFIAGVPLICNIFQP